MPWLRLTGSFLKRVYGLGLRFWVCRGSWVSKLWAVRGFFWVCPKPTHPPTVEGHSEGLRLAPMYVFLVLNILWCYRIHPKTLFEVLRTPYYIKLPLLHATSSLLSRRGCVWSCRSLCQMLIDRATCTRPFGGGGQGARNHLVQGLWSRFVARFGSSMCVSSESLLFMRSSSWVS